MLYRCNNQQQISSKTGRVPERISPEKDFMLVQEAKLQKSWDAHRYIPPVLEMLCYVLYHSGPGLFK